MPTASRLIASLIAVLVLAGCAASPAPPAPARPDDAAPAGAAPVGAPQLYVDPESPAAVQVREWTAQGRTADAELIRRIAEQPVPDWLTRPTGEVGDEARESVAKARAAGQRPFFVTYHIPGRDCGSYSGGGSEGDDDYREWSGEVADAVRGADALVVVEPDAVPHALSCGGSDRLDLIAASVEELKAAGATVYVDAGNPGFVDDVEQLVDALRRSGVDRADGFSLNVANFRTTEENVRFGKQLSGELGGARFVVDTGRNGNGHVGESEIDGGPSWCNPPGRALGSPPTFDTGEQLVDAYLWIKRVGESDGDCRDGEPRAGQWMPEYALELARNARP